MTSEHERDALRAKLSELLQDAHLAEVLMESLPPRRWDELATKDDIRRLEDRIGDLEGRFDGLEGRFDGLSQQVVGIEKTLERYDERFVSLEHKLLAEFRKQTVDQTRLLFFAMIGAIFTTASLAFAAARF
jgi:hypothetical protein